jgi:hypothetical protein
MQGTAEVVPPGYGTVLVEVRLTTLKSGSRFFAVNVHVKSALGVTVDGQVFVTARPDVDRIPSILRPLGSDIVVTVGTFPSAGSADSVVAAFIVTAFAHGVISTADP